MMELAKNQPPIGNYVFDPIVFETARAERLQQIYYSQGTTHAQTAIYGWHFFCLAFDSISAIHEWSVPTAWWKRLAEIAEQCDLRSGFRWIQPDEPHVYFTGLKKSPSDLTRAAYFDTPNWHGLKVFESEEHQAGLQRVWKLVGAI